MESKQSATNTEKLKKNAKRKQARAKGMSRFVASDYSEREAYGHKENRRVEKFVFTVDKGTIGQGSSDLLGAMDFSLSDITGYADLSSVFDQYKLDAVEVRFDPQYTTCDLKNYSATVIKPPRLITVIDYDDANSPASKAVLFAYTTCEVSPPLKSQTRKLKPRMAIAAYSGSFTSYANVQDQWIDAASPNVQHYAVKYAMEGAGVSATSLQQYDITCRYFMSFRATRLT